MATTYHSPSDPQLIVTVPNGPDAPASSNGRAETKSVEYAEAEHAIRPEKKFAASAMSGWELVGRRDTRQSLEASRKSVAARIEAAASALKTTTSTGVILSGDARALSGALADIQLALLDCKAASETVKKLPHVQIPESKSAIARSLALAAAYLRAVDYIFDEKSFSDFIINLQATVALEMFEVWNLKAFLEFAILEQIAKGLPIHTSDSEIDESLRLDRLQFGQSDAAWQRFLNSSSSFSLLIDSLQRISELNWKLSFESISHTEQILRSDPRGAHARMDFETREIYRAAVTDFAERSRRAEFEVAREAIGLARQAANRANDVGNGAHRRAHVGYYLIDKGQSELKSLIGYRPSLRGRIRETLLRWPDYFYLIAIEVITLTAVLFLMIFSHAQKPGIIAVALFLVPAVECAVATINLIAAALLKPRRLPRLDFSAGIPRDFSTVVVIPTLLTSEEQVQQIVRGLEIRFLANRDVNLHFALLTDLPDSNEQFDEKDKLAVLCSRLIEQLNETYVREHKGSFSHLHRHRAYNASEGVWMGWERKRGKLLEFNRYLLNEGDAFPVKAGNLAALANIRYVITLDSDTQLPRDAGRRLVATIAHPLNSAVINPATNTVVEGYGILQPRVDISVRSARRSRFASLLSGDTGVDVYTRAVSDVYQDLFGAGIFTGKGIYDVRTFQKVLEHRFPNNAVLSHDLIEGEYARTGLASDIEVVDDYPSHLRAFARRKHRWMRGDWQIIFALLPWTRNYFGEIVRNPLSHISRWKIVDNLRRSLTEFTIFLLLLFGWFGPRPASIYWTLAALALLAFPTYFQFVFSVLTAGKSLFSKAFWINLCSDFVTAHTTILFRLVFLSYQSLVSLDAAVRTLVRMKFTRKKLLEWETSSDAEQGENEGMHLVDAYLKWTFPLSLGIGILIGVLQPASLPTALPFLLLWGCANPICQWLNRPQKARGVSISEEDGALVRNVALRTWRFFCDFSNKDENWLIPDIVRDSPRLIAHHVSTTNLGLLFNSRLAAYDLGFITLEEFIRDNENTMAVVDRLPKFRGHLYNWYSTQTLKPVEPLFISTVDNGNLLCCLWTLKQGCLDAMEEPLFRPNLWQGILDHVNLLIEVLEGEKSGSHIVSAARELRQQIIELAGPDRTSFDGVAALEIDLTLFLSTLSKSQPSEDALSCGQALSLRVANLTELVWSFAPWLHEKLRKSVPAGVSDIKLSSLTLESAPALYSSLQKDWGLPGKNAKGPARSEGLLSEALDNAALICERTTARLAALIASVQSTADEMHFDFLYNPKKKMLSIGYDAGEGLLNKCHYDLLPSEARAAVFGAIAKSEIPQESWFLLRRMYANFENEPVMRSWTGTTFEYLMPNLWFKMYPNTVLDHAAWAALRAQQKFARKNRIPWGISECSCNEDLPDGHYRYHAFGVPGLALNRDDSAKDLVVSPYSTFLGMLLDPARSLKNVRRMKQLGWLSPFGFYEAADFTAARVRPGNRHEIVCNWMAHHQGMILVAAANVLCDSAIQRRFHAEPCVAATERILQEKRARVISVEKDAEEIREKAPLPTAEVGAALQRPEFRDLVPGLP